MADLKEVFRKRSKATLKRFRFEAVRNGTSTLAEHYHPEVDFSEVAMQDLIEVLDEMLDSPREDDRKIFD